MRRWHTETGLPRTNRPGNKTQLRSPQKRGEHVATYPLDTVRTLRPQS